MRQIAAIRRCDTSPRLYCCCDKALSLSLSLRYVARIQTSLNSCDRSQRQNSVAATMIFTCHTRRFVAAICRGDVSQRFVASCVSAFRELKQTTTATATGTLLNKRFNEQNNSCARALQIFVHFVAVLCQTTTWNHQVLRILENVRHDDGLATRWTSIPSRGE